MIESPVIKVWDYLEELEEEKSDILEGFLKVLHSGRLILGESVKNFESAFSTYCRVAHGVGVDNATNGLFLALKALNIGPGDEVITVSNTAVPTAAAIVAAGATPRFVDIDPDTYLMDVSLLEAAVTPKTKCIIPVHLYGQCVDMTAVAEIALKQGLHVVEDCAQAHGAMRGGKKAGAMSDMGVFSFYPTKPLGGYGDAGMMVTDDPALDRKLRRLRFYGMDTAYYSEEPGYNSRLDEIHAEILLRKLRRLDGYIAARRALAERYDRLLAHTSVKLPTTLPGNEHVSYIYVCAHPERDRIIAELKKRDILVNISYPWPIHTMRGFAQFGYQEGDLPQTELAATRIFSLPMYPALTFTAQDRVCAALGEILKEPVVWE
ncbi:DegT/DnrJ/EryC1/StrS aminotransferase family protein [Desulfonatronum sp. SC1]|uniref:DegT/DnrJ/EryC1/StrS family aminotransferase n=1 Tax=Desulfonatronum sp. SC1 TaxID=2109626 RepID=UPI000D30FC04|nr:DegT/DnrJ/EryC1/StrS family aminotransferase [Desulfonatronum sp. SC1]PTN36494.1 daunorubicin biosynthesis sensory transduction protein DnrJ [Desulfonatronum sp. SC1]